MNNLIINLSGNSFDNCSFSIKDLPTSPSGCRINFENVSLSSKVSIVSCDQSVDNDFVFVPAGVSEVSGILNISCENISSHESVSIFANIEHKVKDVYQLVQIFPCQISIPNAVNDVSDFFVSIEPSSVQYGEIFAVKISGQPNKKLWIDINQREYSIKTDFSGKGSLNLNSSSISNDVSVVQHIRVYVSDESKKKYNTNLKFAVLPINSLKVATTSSSIDTSILAVKTPEDTDKQNYPVAGASYLTDCSTVTAITKVSNDIVNPSSSSSVSTNFNRVNSFSVAKTANNAALVAVSSRENIDYNITVTDENELARIRSNRVHILYSPSTAYASSPRTASVSSLTPANTCPTAFTISVDTDIQDDPKLVHLWVLDPSSHFQGDTENGLVCTIIERIGNSQWVVRPDRDVTVQEEECFSFVAYSDSSCDSYPIGLSKIQPLPYILDNDGLAISAVNPQIASNWHDAPDSNIYGYVIAEAAINGAVQLFFYSFNLTGNEVYGWKQLTTVGDNKNAKIILDSNDNLHITWESSRCAPGQIYYGVLGPASRNLINETLISAIDKQAFLHARLTDLPLKTDSLTPLTLQSKPIAIDPRVSDGYGNRIGDLWTPYTIDGTTTLIDDYTIKCEGNPGLGKFAAFTCLHHDEYENPIDLAFNQFSFQLSFDLHVDISAAFLDKSSIADFYLDWKATFTAINISDTVSGYQDTNSNRYTIGELRYVYDRVIPIAGSYKGIDICGDPYADPYVGSLNQYEQIRLRHFMIAIVPEKARFLASNLETLDQHLDRVGNTDNYSASVQVEYYTGKCQLAIITETSSNISDLRMASQRYHIVKLIGNPFDLTVSHSYKFAVHYAKLSSEAVDSRSSISTIEDLEQNVRFSGNIIMIVDDVVMGAENFVPDFSDLYAQFDIAVGSPLLNEYYPNNITPYDGVTLNSDLYVELNFSEIVIGPHSIQVDTSLISLGEQDRDTSRMLIPSSESALASSHIYMERDVFSTATDPLEKYALSLGLACGGQLSQIPITFEGRNSFPSIAVDTCNKAHIAFQSNRDDNWEIYYSSSLDLNIPFRFDTRITKAEGHSLMPSVAVDSKGRRLVAWQDDRSGKYQIYIARSNKTYDCESWKCPSLPELFGSASPELINDTNTSDPDYTYDYVYSPYYDGSVALTSGQFNRLKFNFTNIGSAESFHFVANFYLDPEMTSLYKSVSSRENIAGWFVDDYMMDYYGALVATGHTASVVYEVSSEDDLSGRIYYVSIQTDLNNDLDLMAEGIVFYCPLSQMPRCSIPCVYTNATGLSQTVHFKVLVFADADHEELIMTSQSNIDPRRWVSGRYLFPAEGLSVSPNETISAVYNPEFLPNDLSFIQNQSTVDSLLCNTNYHIVVQSYVDGVYSDLALATLTEEQLESLTEYELSILADIITYPTGFSLICNCSEFSSPIWRKDEASKDWLCSGQDGMDLRVTLTDNHAIFPSVTGSYDGMIYISWEDHRLSTLEAFNPQSYYAVWDAQNDELFSSAQGYADQQLSTSTVYRPLAIVNNLQHVSTFFNDSQNIYSRICSLYKALTATAVDSSYDNNVLNYLFPDILEPTESDAQSNCFITNVYEKDVVERYHQDSDTPIALVNKCKIRFEITGPTSVYAIRFKNEDQTSFSSWITVAPPFNFGSSSSSSSSNDSLATYLKSYGLASDKTLVEWILSSDSGTKTVSYQIMTNFGVTEIQSINIFARYKELEYTVYFYRDSEKTIPASTFTGYPVVSTNALTIKDGVLSSLSKEIDTSLTNRGTIYIRVIFKDPSYLAELLEYNSLSEFNLSNAITFDVILPGKTLTETLYPVTPTALAFDYSQPAINSGIPLGTYDGQFTIQQSDGFDWIDGYASLVVNVPSACFSSPEVPVCSKLRTTYNDIVLERAVFVDSMKVTSEVFKYNYNPEIKCTFTSCVVNEPVSETCTCASYNWTLPTLGEPCFYVRESENSQQWVVYSQEFEFDFSNIGAHYLSFGADSDFEDIIFMIKPEEEITFTNTSCTTPDSEPCTGITGSVTRQVDFQIPGNSVLIYHNYEQNVKFYINEATACNYPSAGKTFTIYNKEVLSIPQGNSTNNGKDSVSGPATWSIVNAKGNTYTGSLPTLDVEQSLQTTLSKGIAKEELEMLGFMRSNGIVRFKLAFIRSGTGYISIKDMTCAPICS